MKPEQDAGTDERPDGKPLRKAYEIPRLDVYGELGEIAQSLRKGGVSDGSGHPNKHFTS